MDLPPIRALYMITTQGVPPFKNPAAMSHNLKDLILSCTKMTPDERPSASKLLQHPFFAVEANERELRPLVERAMEEASKPLELDMY
jgi:serine/threonine protein kinase